MAEERDVDLSEARPVPEDPVASDSPATKMSAVYPSFTEDLVALAWLAMPVGFETGSESRRLAAGLSTSSDL